MNTELANGGSAKGLSLTAGPAYLLRGLEEVLKPGTKRFVLVPLVANVLVFIALTLYMIQQYTTLSTWVDGQLPDWAWLAYVASFLSGLIIFILVIAYGYSFTAITNLIAAPFYGVLAEKIEERHTGHKAPHEPTGSLILRTLLRELTKLWYFLSRGFLVAVGLLLLSFVPVLQLAVPFLAVLWACRVMALQYVDYPADNNKITFKKMKATLSQHRLAQLSFGGCVLFLSTIPLVNIFVMPVAVAGGAVFWLQEVSE